MKTVVTSGMDRITAVSRMTTDVHRTTTVAHRMVIDALITVLALLSNRTKMDLRTIEMRQTALANGKNTRNET